MKINFDNGWGGCFNEQIWINIYRYFVCLKKRSEHILGSTRFKIQDLVLEEIVLLI